MDQKQSDHFTRDESLLKILNLYKPVWTANATFASAVSALDGKISAVSNLQVGQISGSKGIALSKKQTASNLIALTVAHADAGRAYAVSLNDMTLWENLHVTKSSLHLLPSADLAPVCQNVYNLLNPLVANLGGYGIDASSLLALSDAITTNISFVGAPQSARAGAKAYTSSLALQLDSIDSFIELQLSPLMTQYKISEPVFYDAYVAARKLITRGHRTKVELTVVVTQAGALAEHAIVKLPVNGKPHKKVTDATGKVRYRLTPPLNATVSVELSGFATQTKTVVADTAQKLSVTFAFV